MKRLALARWVQKWGSQSGFDLLGSNDDRDVCRIQQTAILPAFPLETEQAMNNPIRKSTAVEAINPFPGTVRTMMVLFLMLISAFAAPLSLEDNAKIAGNWHVSPPNLERVYEISAGLSVKITGGKLKDKFARLIPQADGSYLMNLEANSVQKVIFDTASDQLTIEHYNSRKDFQLGLVAWKRPGTRMPATKQ